MHKMPLLTLRELCKAPPVSAEYGRESKRKRFVAVVALPLPFKSGQWACHSSAAKRQQPFFRSFLKPASFLSVAAALLTACAPLPPTSQQQAPSMAIPQSWPVDASHNLANENVAQVEAWHAYFKDPQLLGLIEKALQNNRDLRVAMLRVEQARATYGIQRADLLPSIGLGGQAARSRNPADLNASGQAVVAGRYEAFVGLNHWELDLWGRIRSLNEAALQEYFATEAAARAAQLSLVTAVAEAYLGLCELDERIALAQATLDTRKETYRIFRRRNEVGSISTLDLTQVESLLNQARSLTAQLQQARAAQVHALNQLIGETLPPVPTQAHAYQLDDSTFAPLPAGLPSDLLTARPDIIAAEHRLVGANANIDAARAAFLPSIALTGSWGSASAQLDGLFDAGSRAWTFSPSISLPIFTGGRLSANLDLSQVRSEMAVATYENTIQVAFREVADALSSQAWLAEQVDIQHQTLKTLKEWTRLAQLRYDHGAATYLEVLDAQRELLNAEQQLVQLRRAVLSSRVALFKALGGGTYAKEQTAYAPESAPTPSTLPSSRR